MLEVQARKFERLFNKAKDLQITQESYKSCLKGLMELATTPGKGHVVAAYAARNALKRALDEKRVTIVD